MKTSVFLRKAHNWASIVIALQMMLVVSTGLLLLLKKDVDWIQPPTERGVASDVVPSASVETMFDAARSVPELELTDWRDLSRVDFKPGKGVVKFVAANNWEAQIDTETGEVLAVSYRRSDIIESLHDGAFFGDWVKLWLFFPSALALMFLTLSGVYLFIQPRMKKAEKKRKKAGKAAEA